MSISPQTPVAAVESDPGEVQQFRNQITELTEQVTALTTQCPTSQRKSRIRCFNCAGIGYVQCDCPSPSKQTLDSAIIVIVAAIKKHATVIVGEVEGNRTEKMLDSGSLASLMRRDLLLCIRMPFSCLFPPSHS